MAATRRRQCQIAAPVSTRALKNATYPMFSSVNNLNMRSLVCFTATFKAKGHFSRAFLLKLVITLELVNFER